MKILCVFLAAALLVAAGCAPPPSGTGVALRAPDVRYDPSAPAVVAAMIRLARVAPGDVVFDLGCGDGRIVIAALLSGAARGVCVDIDPQRIAEARDNAGRAGVTARIEFRNEDLFATDIRDASVVMLFLWPEVNLKLRPRLARELASGARVVSHWHDMGDWPPGETLSVTDGGRTRPLYLWRIP